MLQRLLFATCLMLLFNCQTQQTKTVDLTDAAKPADRLTIIGINDIYKIEGVANGTKGGLARVRTLRKMYDQSGDVLIMHGGDALSPAAMSQKFAGANMIDVLNMLDGDLEAFDEHMFITFGNHEFDLRSADKLDARVEESQFTWINSNIDWAKNEAGESLVEAETQLVTKLFDVNGRKVGIYSITLNDYEADFIVGFGPYEETARQQIQNLRKQGAELIIGLTHLGAADDKALVEALGDDAPDVVFGGHDHQNMVVVADNGVKIIKADADAVTAQVVHIDFGSDGSKQVTSELKTLDESIEKDPAVQERVEYWLTRYDPTGELAEPVGYTQVALDAYELDIRKYETNLGSWVADQMIAAGAEIGTQAALINSGTLRLNDVIIPGPVSKGNLAELLPYQTDMIVKKVTGADLIRALSYSVTDWAGSGHFLQVGGIRFTHDVTTSTASDFQIKVDGSFQPVDPEQTYLITLSSYIAKGGDGYDWFGDLDTVKNLGDLQTFLIQRLEAVGQPGIDPQEDGRINTVEVQN